MLCQMLNTAPGKTVNGEKYLIATATLKPEYGLILVFTRASIIAALSQSHLAVRELV